MDTSKGTPHHGAPTPGADAAGGPGSRVERNARADWIAQGFEDGDPLRRMLEAAGHSGEYTVAEALSDPGELAVTIDLRDDTTDPDAIPTTFVTRAGDVAEVLDRIRDELEARGRLQPDDKDRREKLDRVLMVNGFVAIRAEMGKVIAAIDPLPNQALDALEHYLHGRQAEAKLAGRTDALDGMDRDLEVVAAVRAFNDALEAIERKFAARAEIRAGHGKPRPTRPR
jgi:hypothetical protein